MCRGGPKCVAINSRSRHVAGVKRRLNSGITNSPSDSTRLRSSSQLVPILAQAAGDVGRLAGLPHEVQQGVAVPRRVEHQDAPHVRLSQEGRHALIGSGPELEGHLLAAAGDRIIDGPHPDPMPQFFQHRPITAFPNGTETDETQVDHSTRVLAVRETADVLYRYGIGIIGMNSPAPQRGSFDPPHAPPHSFHSTRETPRNHRPAGKPSVVRAMAYHSGPLGT